MCWESTVACTPQKLLSHSSLRSVQDEHLCRPSMHQAVPPPRPRPRPCSSGQNCASFITAEPQLTHAASHSSHLQPGNPCRCVCVCVGGGCATGCRWESWQSDWPESGMLASLGRRRCEVSRKSADPALIPHLLPANAAGPNPTFITC